MRFSVVPGLAAALSAYATQEHAATLPLMEAVPASPGLNVAVVAALIVMAASRLRESDAGGARR